MICKILSIQVIALHSTVAGLVKCEEPFTIVLTLQSLWGTGPGRLSMWTVVVSWCLVFITDLTLAHLRDRLFFCLRQNAISVNASKNTKRERRHYFLEFPTWPVDDLLASNFGNRLFLKKINISKPPKISNVRPLIDIGANKPIIGSVDNMSRFKVSSQIFTKIDLLNKAIDPRDQRQLLCKLKEKASCTHCFETVGVPRATEEPISMWSGTRCTWKSCSTYILQSATWTSPNPPVVFDSADYTDPPVQLSVFLLP